MSSDIESMAKNAANRMPVSRRDRPAGVPYGASRGQGQKVGLNKPNIAGIEAGTESAMVAAPGKPVVEKAKEYIKPFAGKMPPTPKGALERAIGRGV
jgi:hypothetical protein